MRFVDSPALNHVPIAAAGTPALRLAPPALITRFIPPIVVAGHLPEFGAAVGNVIRDSSDPATAWYLPAFGLPAEVDRAFRFAATRTGVDADGKPFDRVTLTLTLASVEPPDAVAYAAANPTVTLREVALAGLAVGLTTTARDPQSGAVTTSTYNGTITAAGDGQFLVVFSTLLGAAAIVAYENLQSGGATIGVTATYTAWHPSRCPLPPPGPLPPRPIPPRPFPPRPLPQELQLADRPIAAFTSCGFTTTVNYSTSIALGTKFADSAYALTYTITDDAGTVHPIVSVSDLTSFDTRQTEFRPYTALGDVSLKYPSIRALYLGVLSRTIVAIPARYGILRGSAGTAAICRAVLDSSAGSTNACSFEFSFVLGAVVDPIELATLAQQIAADSSSEDCTLVLPSQLDPNVAPVVNTGFASTVTCVPGAQAQTFAFTVRVADTAGGAPAVADANLFIAALIAHVQPYLSGQIGIKLDDYYPQPVPAAVVLNFSLTSGSDDVRLSADPASGAVLLANVSPLDLSILRYAQVAAGGESVTIVNAPLAAGATLPLPAIAAANTAGVLVDRTLELESPLTKSATARYLAFDVNDVQDVAYDIGIVAAGIDFVARKIARIEVNVTLTALPAISVPLITLTGADTAGNVQIALPVQDALTTLAATIAMRVVSSDPGKAPVAFTLTNDFISEPVFVLSDPAVPPFAPATP